MIFLSSTIQTRRYNGWLQFINCLTQMNKTNLYILLALVLAAHCQENVITIKSSITAVPEITEHYDVVHQNLYPSQAEPVATALPKNFFVEKALKNKPKKIETKQPSISPQVENTLNHNNLQGDQTKSEPSPLTNNRNRPLKSNALGVNNNLDIGWRIEAPKDIPYYVVEKGNQVKLTEAPLKDKSLPLIAQEGKMPQLTLNPPKPETAVPTISHTSPDFNNKREEVKKPVVTSEVENKELQQHRKKFWLISGMLVVLVFVFFLVRGQKKKRESIDRLHSRFQNYKEEQSSIFKAKEEEEEALENNSMDSQNSDEQKPSNVLMQ